MGVAEKGSKSRLAQELGVSRSSLYYKRKMPAKDGALRREIEAVMAENPGYGSPRVAIALGINEKRAARVMRKFALKPARRCLTPRKRGDEGREPLKYPNILARLSPTVPDMVWTSDITFISYRNEFVFLCTVMDVFTGEVLGFNISRNHDARFVRLAIERAIHSTGYVPEWFHSNQGREYASGTVCTWLESMGVQISMNPKGLPWCNGSQKSFVGRFKVEFGDFDRFDSLAELLKSSMTKFTISLFEELRTNSKCLGRSSEKSGSMKEKNCLQFSTLINRLPVSPRPPSRHSVPDFSTTTI